jgi:hypothetical protein
MKMKKKSLVVAMSLLAIAACSTEEESDTNAGGSSKPQPNPTITIDKLETVSEPKNNGSELNYIRVNISKALTNEVTFKLTSNDIEAQSSGQFKNYESIEQTFTIPAGARFIDVPYTVFHNEKYENNVSFQLVLSDPSGATFDILDDTATITIKDIDREPEIEFEYTTIPSIEGEKVDVKMLLSNYSKFPVSVDLMHTGIATTTDFTTDLQNNRLEIAPETLESQFEVLLVDDGLLEGGESLTFSIKSVSNANPGNKDSITIAVGGEFGLNDTGVNQFYDGSVFTSVVSPSEYPNQDASNGNDILDPHNEHYDGSEGFRFHKLDFNGNNLAADVSEFSCIKDNVTGLYIESKMTSDPVGYTTAAAIAELINEWKLEPVGEHPFTSNILNWRSIAYGYTWYNVSSNENGGNAGSKNDKEGSYSKDYPVSPDCAFPSKTSTDQCHTQNYIKILNEISLCGADDWRLPTPSEARSIVNYGLDKSQYNFFPHNEETGAQTRFFTSATSVNNQGSAWCIDSTNGQIELCHKDVPVGVIAVRGGMQ